LAREILRLGRIRRIKDQPLFAMGDESNGLYGVLSGEVRISHAFRDGGAGLLFVANAGTWFGETSLLDDRARNSDAVAIGQVELLFLSKGHFRTLTRNVAYYPAFVRLLCEHHRLAMDHLANLGALPSFARLAQRLLFFGQSQDGSDSHRRLVHVSQEKLASAIGISRQALNAQLQKLASRGVISLGYATIEVRNPSALAQILNRALEARGDRR
jgi:CRP-like cAMP-binding protein